jgi:hypothetical protein
MKINASLIQADANKQSSIADQYLSSDRDPARPSRLSESRMQLGATKPFSVAGEAALKQRYPTLVGGQTIGFDHDNPAPTAIYRRSIPPSRLDARGSKVMAEAVTALCVFFSSSIFLAHGVDALRAAR